MKRHNTIHFASQARSVALACGLAVAVALPAWSAPASDTHYPKVLHDIIAAGKLQVVQTFATDKYGMTGYIVKRDGYQTVVYSEGGYLMLGPLYGPQGQNLSKQYARKYTPKPDVGKVIHSLDADHMVTQGPKNAPGLYVFADPNCIYCHKLYEQAQSLVKAGNLRIHWILVGVLGPISVGRAVTVLEAKDSAAALAKNEANFDVANEQGGVAIAQPNAVLDNVVQKNSQAMFSLGSSGTPTVVYSDEEGRLQSHQGVPPHGWLAHYAQD